MKLSNGFQESLTKTETIASQREEICRLHAKWKLCGLLANVFGADKLLTCLLLLLGYDPSSLPSMSCSEWSDMITLLNSHRMLPLLFWKIGHLPEHLHPPEPIIKKLREAFMVSRARCFRMERQLAELTEAFTREGISVLVIKGPALARFVYSDSATRPSSDLDLLVKPAQFVKIREILQEIGYQCESKNFEGLKDVHYEDHFIYRNNSFNYYMIELHWDQHRFFGYERGDKIEELFSRSINVKTATLNFTTFHPVDALIHAALHLIMTHNQEIRLIWIYDIALLAQKLLVPNDWETLQKRSVAWGARLAVEYSLKMAQMWTGLKLPKGFNDFLTWPEPSKQELAATTIAIQRYDKPANWFKICLSNPSTIKQKFQVLFKTLFPDLAYMQNTYASSRDWLLPFSYVRRLWKWFVRAI